MTKKETILTLVEKILDGTDLILSVDSYQLEELLETHDVKIKCHVHHQKTGARSVIEGRGVGIVDAFFHGFVEIYSKEFPSLNTIKFVDFSVSATIDNREEGWGCDSMAEVKLHVENSDGHVFPFAHKSPSITRSCIQAVLEAGEFFINSERAFIAVYKALQHARESSRPDSVSHYTNYLTTLVSATSYTEVIDRVKREELPDLEE